MNNKNSVYFADEETMNAQKGLLILVLKRATSAFISGESVMNMSIPV